MNLNDEILRVKDKISKNQPLAFRVVVSKIILKHHGRKLSSNRSTARDFKQESCNGFIAEGDAVYLPNEVSESMRGYTSQAGVQLTNRPIASIGMRSKPNADHAISDSVIAETTWDLERVLKRPNYIGSFEWSSAAVSRTLLHSYRLPYDLLTTMLIRAPFNTFKYWRGDVVVQFQVAGSPLYQGLIGVTFLPLLTSDVMAVFFNSGLNMLANLTVNPTIYLYANANTVGEIRIPFNHYKSYLETGFLSDLDGSLGYLVAYVINPLTGIEPISINISAYSFFDNSQLKVPRYIPSAPTDFVAEGFSDILKTGVNAVAGINGIIGKALPKNIVTDTIGTAASIASGILDWLPFDRPSVPIATDMVVIRGAGSFNTSVGPDFVDKYNLYPQSMNISTGEHFGTTEDEMNFDFLKQKFSYMDTFTITSKALPGDVLYSVELAPLKSSYVVGDVIQEANTAFPLLGYLSLPFAFWRGGLTYKIQVSASSMHSCKMFAMFNYGQMSISSPVSISGIGSQYGIAMEVCQGTNEFIFTVPYVAPTPYLNVPHGPGSLSSFMGTLNIVLINKLIAPSSVAPSISCNIFIAGGEDFDLNTFTIGNNFVPVTVIAAIPPKTSFKFESDDDKIECSHSDDTNFIAESDTSTPKSVISKVFDSRDGEGSLAEHGVAPLSVSATTTNSATDHNVISPVAGSTEQIIGHFGTKLISLGDVMKKYQLVSTTTFIASPDGKSMKMVGFPIMNFFSPCQVYEAGPKAILKRTLLGPNSGLTTWISGLYRQFRGPIKFKLVVSNVNVNMTSMTIYPSFTAYWIPSVGTNNTFLNDNDIMAYLGSRDNNADSNTGYSDVGITASLARLPCYQSTCIYPNAVIEGEIPFTSLYNTLVLPYPKLLAGDMSTPPESTLGTLLVIMNTPRDENMTTCTMKLYLALGDEARFGCLTYNSAVFLNGATSVQTSAGQLTKPLFPDTYAVQPPPPPPSVLRGNIESIGPAGFINATRGVIDEEDDLVHVNSHGADVHFNNQTNQKKRSFFSRN